MHTEHILLQTPVRIIIIVWSNWKHGLRWKSIWTMKCSIPTKLPKPEEPCYLPRSPVCLLPAVGPEETFFSKQGMCICLEIYGTHFHFPCGRKKVVVCGNEKVLLRLYSQRVQDEPSSRHIILFLWWLMSILQPAPFAMCVCLVLICKKRKSSPELEAKTIDYLSIYE